MRKNFSIQLGLLALCALLLVGAFYLVGFQNPPKQIVNVQSSAPKQIDSTSIFLAGDIMLSRNVADKIYQANDIDLPFEQISDVTKNADIAFANLESPFGEKGAHFVPNSLIFNADPKFVDGLKNAGFNILSTANNHALDQGQLGIDYTYELLKSHGIIPSGTVSTAEDPLLPVIKKNDILFGFLSYSYTALNDGGKTTDPHINDFNNLAKLKQDILSLKGHYADVVIVNMHAGVEYTRQPTQSQINFAHAAIDAGADLVVGEHPHWIQTIENYKGHWIFYSLGNLVFDQMWSQETREGLTLLVTFDKNEIKRIELKPVIIDNFCCPRFANEDETKSILEKINPVTNTAILVDNGVVTDSWKEAVNGKK